MYHSQRWVTNFPKGDSHSQRIVDSEATHTWEMRFHTHHSNTSFHLIFSSITSTNKATLALNIQTPNTNQKEKELLHHHEQCNGFLQQQHYQLDFSSITLHKDTLALIHLQTTLNSLSIQQMTRRIKRRLPKITTTYHVENNLY